jgi:hypothetical protein
MISEESGHRTSFLEFAKTEISNQKYESLESYKRNAFTGMLRLFSVRYRIYEHMYHLLEGISIDGENPLQEDPRFEIAMDSYLDEKKQDKSLLKLSLYRELGMKDYSELVSAMEGELQKTEETGRPLMEEWQKLSEGSEDWSTIKKVYVYFRNRHTINRLSEELYGPTWNIVAIDDFLTPSKHHLSLEMFLDGKFVKRISKKKKSGYL